MLTSPYFSLTLLCLIGHCLSELSLDIDECKQLCADNSNLLPVLSWGDEPQTYCQTGCRFLNIIDSLDEQSWNVTQKECYISCSESYLSPRENKSCSIGCDLMIKKKQKSPVTKTIEEQDFDSLEGDIFLDPMIRKQLQMDFDVKFKIPEAYIRTMPIDDKDIEVVKTVNTKFDFSCLPLAKISLFALAACALIISAVSWLNIIQLIRTMRNPPAIHEDLIEAPQEVLRVDKLEKPLLLFTNENL